MLKPGLRPNLANTYKKWITNSDKRDFSSLKLDQIKAAMKNSLDVLRELQEVQSRLDDSAQDGLPLTDTDYILFGIVNEL